jgi:hypothetical protein
VVWLCAYGWHRSGEGDDAFKRFADLIERDVIYPDADDYRRLLDARAHRFVELAPIDARALLNVALRAPGTIQTGRLGGRVGVRIISDVLAGIAEISVAFSPAGLNQREIAFVLACFAPEREASLSDVADTLAGSPLQPEEIAFDIMTAVQEA